jgi:hypothetical protein
MINNICRAGNRRSQQYRCDFCDGYSIYKPSKGVITPMMECNSCGRYVCTRHRVIDRVPEPDDMRIYSIECYCLECWKSRTEQDDMFKPVSHMEQVAPCMGARV